MDDRIDARCARGILMRAQLFMGFALLAAITGCNGVAGISDLITGDLDASSDAASDSSTNADGSSADASADAAVDGGGGIDADLPPLCTGANVGLRITVSPSTQFNDVRDDNNGILVPAGTTSTYCFAAGTQIELQADPDMSNASHVWGTALCSPGRRCAFTLAVPMAIDVTL